MKKLISIILCIIVLFSFSVNSYANSSDTEIVSTGECGSNSKYVIYDNGIVDIEGNGSINQAPWSNNDNIWCIRINEGITSIDNNNVAFGKNINTILIPKSTKSVKKQLKIYSDSTHKKIVVSYSGSESEGKILLSNSFDSEAQKRILFYYDGIVPDAFCKFDTDKDKIQSFINPSTVSADCYYGKYYDATFDSRLDGSEEYGSGTDYTFTLNKLTLGENELKIMLISKEGQIVAEDKITYSISPIVQALYVFASLPYMSIVAFITVITFIFNPIISIFN